MLRCCRADNNYSHVVVWSPMMADQSVDSGKIIVLFVISFLVSIIGYWPCWSSAFKSLVKLLSIQYFSQFLLTNGSCYGNVDKPAPVVRRWNAINTHRHTHTKRFHVISVHQLHAQSIGWSGAIEDTFSRFCAARLNPKPCGYKASFLIMQRLLYKKLPPGQLENFLYCFTLTKKKYKLVLFRSGGKCKRDSGGDKAERFAVKRVYFKRRHHVLSPLMKGGRWWGDANLGANKKMVECRWRFANIRLNEIGSMHLQVLLFKLTTSLLSNYSRRNHPQTHSKRIRIQIDTWKILSSLEPDFVIKSYINICIEHYCRKPIVMPTPSKV